MNSPETYTAYLRDRPFGPVVERLDGLRLVDRRPDSLLRRYFDRAGERWVRVYELDAGPENGGDGGFTYQLSSEGPASAAEDSAPGTE